MYHLLSYPLKKGDPAWPGNPSLEITPHTSIAQGDVANTCTIHLFNHYGTHLDAPLHFCAKGQPLSDLKLEQFIYQAPLLLDIAKNAGEKIEPEDLQPFDSEILDCDLLMIRTGFWNIRTEQPSIYEQNGPAVSSRAAQYLMEHYKNLKAIALDFVSLASYSDPTDGNLAHQYLLGQYHDHHICIIEDVNLGGLCRRHYKGAAAIPLLIEGIDSCPVTMWLEE